MAGSPIPVRLTETQIERLDTVRQTLGTTRTGVIKMCLLAFLQRFEKEGLAMLPPDWEVRLVEMDGRTSLYKKNEIEHPVLSQRVAEKKEAYSVRPRTNPKSTRKKPSSDQPFLDQ